MSHPGRKALPGISRALVEESQLCIHPVGSPQWSFLSDLGSRFLVVVLLVGGEITQTHAALSHALGWPWLGHQDEGGSLDAGHIPPWAWCPAVVIEPPGSICREQSLLLSMGPAASLTLVLALQGQAVALLPFFSSLTGDRLQELRHVLEKLIVSHFPMRSGEFPPGTLRYSNYVDCMKKVSSQ